MLLHSFHIVQTPNASKPHNIQPYHDKPNYWIVDHKNVGHWFPFLMEY
jgi:hypothetical protein